MSISCFVWNSFDLNTSWSTVWNCLMCVNPQNLILLYIYLWPDFVGQENYSREILWNTAAVPVRWDSSCECAWSFLNSWTSRCGWSSPTKTYVAEKVIVEEIDQSVCRVYNFFAIHQKHTKFIDEFAKNLKREETFLQTPIFLFIFPDKLYQSWWLQQEWTIKTWGVGPWA